MIGASRDKFIFICKQSAFKSSSKCILAARVKSGMLYTWMMPFFEPTPRNMFPGGLWQWKELQMAGPISEISLTTFGGLLNDQSLILNREEVSVVVLGVAEECTERAGDDESAELASAASVFNDSAATLA